MAFITSKIPNEISETDLVIDEQDTNFHQTGLKVSSTVTLHRLMTVSTDIIKRQLGDLAEEQKGEVRIKLLRLFKIDLSGEDQLPLT